MGAGIARVLVTGGVLFGLAGSARAQAEGPLDNDAYLPVSALAEAELARGDQAFARALATSGQEDSVWTLPCEAWRNALVKGRPGESASPRPTTRPEEVSPWPAVDAAERFTEGLEAAVFRRLAQLPPAGRRVWSLRFSPLANEELQLAGGSSLALQRLERELPATSGAARAALLLAEIAFERAEPGAARAWLARAERHAAFEDPPDPSLRRGIELRAAALPIAAADEHAWQAAVTLARVAGHALEVPRNASSRPRPLGAGPQAGMAFLDEHRALIQTPGALWTLEGETLHGPFEHRAWLGAVGRDVPSAVAPGDPPGWRLDPATQGSSAVVVAGRSLNGRANVLVRLDLSSLSEIPRVAWVLSAGPTAAGTDTESAGDQFEFQPGPLWRDGSIFVLVRSSGNTGERELELRALDPEQGRLRWSAFLGKGGERTRDWGRFARRGLASMPAEPLVAAEGGIFACAELGFAALVDPLDGRLAYTLRNRRRPSEERGFTGWGPAVAAGGRAIGWAPSDSDHLYVVDGAGRSAAPTPLLATPEPRGEAEGLVTADAGQALVLSHAGARWALSRWDLATGARQDALHLGPEEVFSGRALASEQRVLAASDRALYLFDRDRDLTLLAAPALDGPVPRGGNVWARGARVYVLSSRYLEIFHAR